jgi:hypothetical protein
MTAIHHLTVDSGRIVIGDPAMSSIGSSYLLDHLDRSPRISGDFENANAISQHHD